jgi:integrase
MARGSVLLEVQDLAAEIPALAHLPGGIDTALRTNLTRPVAQRYMKAVSNLFQFILTHWPRSTLLPIAIPILLLYLQSIYTEEQSVSRIDTTVRAITWFHRIYGHPIISDGTLTAARAGWARMSSSRIKHTAHISSAQIATMLKYAMDQQTFVMFRVAVIIALMGTSGLRKINILALCAYDLFFYSDRLVIFVATCKNRQTRHGSFRTIARTPDIGWCAVTLLEQYLLRTGISLSSADVDRACPIFRASRGAKGKTVLVPATWNTRPIAATTINATFREIADHLGFHKITFHSMRVWMASTLMAAEGLILTKVHGDWKSDSVHTYIEQSADALLTPSSTLTAELAAQISCQQPAADVSMPTVLPTAAPLFPVHSETVAPDEVLVSW